MESPYYKSERKICEILKYTSGLTVQCSEKRPCAVRSKYSERQIRRRTNRGNLQKHSVADFTKCSHYRQGLTAFLPVRNIFCKHPMFISDCHPPSPLPRRHLCICHCNSLSHSVRSEWQVLEKKKNLRENLGQITYFVFFEKLGTGAQENCNP